jgi:sugar phosphate isomerase/epimerase
LGIKLSLENLSYTSTGFGRNVEQLNEVLGVIDPKADMGITFDFCHALETKEVDNLLDAYGRRVCNVHMANKNHQAFTEKKPKLTHFLSRLQSFSYDGPITLELHRDTPKEDLIKTKKLFDELLKEY